MTGITPGIALTCPNDRVGNDQRICVNESLTRIALHPDADQVEIFSTALVDKSVGGFEGNGQIEFQILGDQNAIPLPGNDTAVIRLNECTYVDVFAMYVCICLYMYICVRMHICKLNAWYVHTYACLCIQWNLSIKDTLGP